MALARSSEPVTQSYAFLTSWPFEVTVYSLKSQFLGKGKSKISKFSPDRIIENGLRSCRNAFNSVWPTLRVQVAKLCDGRRMTMEVYSLILMSSSCRRPIPSAVLTMPKFIFTLEKRIIASIESNPSSLARSDLACPSRMKYFSP